MIIALLTKLKIIMICWWFKDNVHWSEDSIIDNNHQLMIKSIFKNQIVTIVTKWWLNEKNEVITNLLKGLRIKEYLKMWFPFLCTIITKPSSPWPQSQSKRYEKEHEYLIVDIYHFIYLVFHPRYLIVYIYDIELWWNK